MASSRFLEVDPNILTKIADLYQRTEDSLNQDVTTLKRWMETQHHLPEIMNDKSIENMFILCKCSIEKAKQRMDMYYTIRNQLPDVYEDINPKSFQVRQNMDIAYHVPLPKMTPEMYRVMFFKMRNKSMVDQLEPQNLEKVLFNTFEIRLNEDTMLGDIHVFDMSGVNFGYITKVTPSFIQKFLVVYKKIFSLPLKGIYYLNTPPYIETLLMIMKKLLKPKLFDRIHLCKDESILMQRFPKEILPKDYGGEEKSLEELQRIYDNLKNIYDLQIADCRKISFFSMRSASIIWIL